jgi:alpha-tubulin suppressor-like RCC1 family protein
VPHKVPGVTGATAISGGYYFSIVVAGNGTVWGWGRNNDGQIGIGTAGISSTPLEVLR